MAEQANGCIDQIEAALRAVGGSLQHVVRITAWLTRLDEYGEYNRVRGERFGANLPASAAVQVAGLLRGALIEIDAVAFQTDAEDRTTLRALFRLAVQAYARGIPLLPKAIRASPIFNPVCGSR